MGDPPGDVTQLAIENVSVTFVVSEGAFRRRKIHAVEGVSLVVRRGEAMGLVGESGSGKTTLARTVVKLNRPNSGRILFEGNDVFAQKKKSNKQYRKHVQIVFQDP
jgi:ABC-type oligopeptide transport system ATPase subunit